MEQLLRGIRARRARVDAGLGAERESAIFLSGSETRCAPVDPIAPDPDFADPLRGYDWDADEHLSIEPCSGEVDAAFLREIDDLLAPIPSTGRIDRTRLTQTLRENERERRSSPKTEVVGRLAGGLAHDINNLLSVILTVGELLFEQLEPGSPERADADTIREAAGRAAALTRRLLLFAGDGASEPQAIDLNDLLAGMDRMLQCVLGPEIELVWRTEGPPLTVIADPGSLERVVMNLVVNARDAMPAGGTLTIATSSLTVGEDPARGHEGATPGPHALLAVSDTGVGMDEATLARIFDPFFTTKERGKGTGLGLSTVRGIVAQSGGSVCAASKVGEGTTFHVLLPRAGGEGAHE